MELTAADRRYGGIVAGILAMAAVLLLGVGVACGTTEPTATHVPTPTGVPEVLDPVVILQEATEQLLALESASFVLEHHTGTTRLFPGLEMSRASGAVELPDRAELKVEAELAAPRSYVEINIVTIEDKAYMTDFITGQWGEVPIESLPFTLHGMGHTLAGIVEQMKQPELLERPAGAEDHLIRGQLKSQHLLGLIPGAAQDLDVTLELSLSRSDSLLRLASITGQVLTTDVVDAVRVLTLSDINGPIAIIAPE